MGTDALRRMVGDLREARRYVVANPQHARDQASGILERMRRIPESIPESGETIGRLIANLSVGCFFATVAPEVLRGYLDGAALELEARSWAIDVTKGGDA
jgi:hypothetical protein